MYETIKEWVSGLWGKTSTLLLAIGVAILPVLQTIDPAMLDSMPWLRTLIIVTGLLVAVLRVLAPPPPSVPIKTEDAVIADHANGTITIAKAGAIPANITDKPAGEKM